MQSTQNVNALALWAEVLQLKQNTTSEEAYLKALIKQSKVCYTASIVI